MVERLSDALGVSSSGSSVGKSVEEARGGSKAVGSGEGDGGDGGDGGGAGAGVGEAGIVQQQEIERLRKHTASLER